MRKKTREPICAGSVLIGRDEKEAVWAKLRRSEREAIKVRRTGWQGLESLGERAEVMKCSE